MLVTIVLATVTVVGVIGLKVLFKKQDKEAEQKRQEDRVNRVTAAVMSALCNPNSITYQGQYTSLEAAFIKSFIARQLRGEREPRAQEYVEKALKWRAENLHGAIARRTTHQTLLKRVRRKMSGQFTTWEITQFITEEEMVDREVENARNDFFRLREDADQLGFRTWSNYQDYLLLKLQ